MSRFNVDCDQHVLKTYLQEIRLTPLLTREEELALARRIQQGDEEAFQALVRANLRFVVNVVKRYRRSGLSLLDLIDEGNVGLCRAARKYNPDLGLRFLSYAVWWIRNSLALFLARQGGIISIPVKKISLVYQLETIHQKLHAKLHRPPRPEELAGELEVSVAEVNQLTQALHGVVSLDRYLHLENGHLKDVIDSSSTSPIEKHFCLMSFREYLGERMNQLKEREKRALELYFGLEGTTKVTSFAELGRALSISREGARLLFHRAIERLKRIVSHDNQLTDWDL
ncbi:MAG: RNA polymerase sigma factor RpoD/SigA [Candidatus Riflebacteria bacterium]|nr:RNA polymerase sigma factor RpoD/SigA [Candidatus Riflebacteria bacterium]